MVGIFETIFSIIDFIATLITYISSIIAMVISLCSSFFVSMPPFISMGYMAVFGLGMLILLIKMYR